jgi:phosphatidylinositol-4,5-bisphosphate 3-kinase
MLSGSFRQDLLNEVMVNDKLNGIAENVKSAASGNRLEILQKEILTIRKSFPTPFSFALDSRMEA